MDETTISQVNPQAAFVAPSQSSPSGRKKIILPVLFVLILIGIIAGGTAFLRSRGETIPTPTPFPTSPPTETPTPTVEETPAPKAKTTPTKKPTPTKEATTSASSGQATSKGLTVRVLNGSGIAGRAAGLADYLKGLGYEIGGTGNAESDDFDKTTITIKKDKESLLAGLKSDVATKYEVGTTSATLAASESHDALVIIGKQ